MIRTLGLYFFRRYMMTTLWFFLGVISITFLIDFTETSSRFDSLPGYSLGGVLYLTALRLPLILQQTVPFIGLFVGMATLISFNRKSELVVARAAGISVWQFMAPFVIGAALVGLATTLVINPLAAWGQRQGRRSSRTGARRQPAPSRSRSRGFVRAAATPTWPSAHRACSKTVRFWWMRCCCISTKRDESSFGRIPAQRSWKMVTGSLPTSPSPVPGRSRRGSPRLGCRQT